MMRIRAVLDSISINRLAGLGLWLTLLAAVLTIPLQIRDFALPVIPRAQLATTPERQTLAALGDVPYEILRDAHAVLPVNASVLLVTDGTDVRHREYTTFHRALYYLTPRSVWWLSPAPNDGTWEARWWHSAPLTEAAISEYADSNQVDFVLLLTNQNLFPTNHTLARWNAARLVQLGGGYIRTAQLSAREFAPADWSWRVVAMLALFFLNGALLLKLVTRGVLALGHFEWFALAWCIGVGFVAFLLLALLALGLTLATSLWVVTGTASLGAAFMAFDLLRSQNDIRQRSLLAARSIDVQWQSLLLVALMVVQTAYVALIALGQPLTFWDSWVTWSIKARTLYLEQTLSPAILTDVSRAVTHLDYPLLLPLAQAALYQLLGAADDRFVGWIAVFFFLALIGLVYSSARKFGAARGHALLAAAAVGALPTIALLAAQNYAEIPLAVYGIVTITFLLCYIERGGPGILVIALLGAACLAWTKREGFILALSIAMSALILFRRAPRARQGAFACAVAGGVVAIGWTLWLGAQGTSNTDLSPLAFSTLIENLDRIPTILFYFAGTLVSVQWTFVWVWVAVLLLFRLERRVDRSYDLYLVSAVLYVAALSLTYLFSDYAPYTAHLASSGYRLVAHVTPVLVIWLALQRTLQSSASDPNDLNKTSYTAGHGSMDFRHVHEQKISHLRQCG